MWMENPTAGCLGRTRPAPGGYNARAGTNPWKATPRVRSGARADEASLRVALPAVSECDSGPCPPLHRIFGRFAVGRCRCNVPVGSTDAECSYEELSADI